MSEKARIFTPNWQKEPKTMIREISSKCCQDTRECISSSLMVTWKILPVSECRLEKKTMDCGHMTTEREINGVVELAKGVYWVGAIDWNGRDFHGFITPGGTTYNSYLVIGEKTALIDTVKAPFAGEMLRRISQIIDPSKLDYIVVNHMEPDHSGSLAELKKQTDAQIIITKRGLDILNGYFRDEGSEKWDFETVQTGDQLDLGSKTLIFLEATMLHWPDSMETFLKEDRILFSNDGLGQHIATSKRYDFEVGDVIPEAAEYYANILMPFHMPLLSYFRVLEELEIEPLQIAPSHGIIWKQDLKKILEAYRAWANGEVKEKVLVIYLSL